MSETDPAKIAAHIRARIAKSGLDSPAVHISREGWATILDLLDARAEVGCEAVASKELVDAARELAASARAVLNSDGAAVFYVELEACLDHVEGIIGDAAPAPNASAAHWQESIRIGVMSNLPDEVGPIAPEQVLTNLDPWAGMSPAEIAAAKARG